MTQEEMVLEYLKAGNSLTPLDALQKFGCFRLSAVIFNLKKYGHNIKTEMISNGTRFGKKQFAKYTIAPRQDPPGKTNLFGGL